MEGSQIQPPSHIQSEFYLFLIKMQLKVYKLKELSVLENIHEKTAQYRAKKGIYIPVEIKVSQNSKD
jgi:hypothetical protein